ncbi:hypothetical protein COU01_02785 [Candidatus Falkowbacteria bacterium CG10_big_fil_rev_8_21_14_0_10_44_15]|uniref:Methyltransferase type 11 domain-containing protein n=1 Tax=Candidatus Falkowbacteria bacterium CG10_big_fil_rev_8_21_14_0_10_44_15 TaxID=1974569 RepID=A0A2H0UZI0_9BACT|nr:MAG: hypothetical protein COU01_02785 [Candidatus Falkowbacteria bacterium CG10_big_fil_rev_8_21_14_0_10_44_15]
MAKAVKFHKVRYVYSDVVSLVRNYTNKQGKVLEIGCGTGNNLVFFAENGWDTYGIDSNKKATEYARKLLKSKNQKAKVVTGNVEELPYRDKEFDLVLDRACLQHNQINSIKNIIKEVRRVLNRGGVFIIVNFRSKKDFSAKNFKKDKTFKIYDYVHYTTEKELRSLLKEFKIIYMEHLKTEVLIPKRYNKGTYILVAKKL